MAKGKSETGVLLHLTPEQIEVTENIRFGLLESRVQSLMASITERGGIMEPIEVEPNNGSGYPLIDGAYRQEAARRLNVDGAGLTIPAVVAIVADPVDRLRRQLAHNMERENQSPMDQAIAIQRLLDAGVSKMDVRSIFARPGGRKGAKVQPASNSFVNMTLSFLDLPLGMQKKIHEGLIGTAAAYELTKVAPEDRQVVLDRAEAAMEAERGKEEKEEEKYLLAHKKEEEAKEKVGTVSTEFEAAKAAVQTATEAFNAAVEASKNAYAAKASLHPKDTAAEVKKEKEEAFSAAELARREAAKALETAKVELAKVEKTFTKAQENAAAITERLSQARGKAKGKAVGPTQVQQAVKDTGAQSVKAPSGLTAKDMREAVRFLTGQGATPKVHAIGVALGRCFSGLTTPRMLYRELQKVTGESSEAYPTGGAAERIEKQASPAAQAREALKNSEKSAGAAARAKARGK